MPRGTLRVASARIKSNRSSRGSSSNRSSTTSRPSSASPDLSPSSKEKSPSKDRSSSATGTDNSQSPTPQNKKDLKSLRNDRSNLCFKQLLRTMGCCVSKLDDRAPICARWLTNAEHEFSQLKSRFPDSIREPTTVGALKAFSDESTRIRETATIEAEAWEKIDMWWSDGKTNSGENDPLRELSQIARDFKMYEEDVRKVQNGFKITKENGLKFPIKGKQRGKNGITIKFGEDNKPVYQSVGKINKQMVLNPSEQANQLERVSSLLEECDSLSKQITEGRIAVVRIVRETWLGYTQKRDALTKLGKILEVTDELKAFHTKIVGFDESSNGNIDPAVTTVNSAVVVDSTIVTTAKGTAESTSDVTKTVLRKSGEVREIRFHDVVKNLQSPEETENLRKELQCLIREFDYHYDVVTEHNKKPEFSKLNIGFVVATCVPLPPDENGILNDGDKGNATVAITPLVAKIPTYPDSPSHVNTTENARAAQEKLRCLRKLLVTIAPLLTKIRKNESKIDTNYTFECTHLYKLPKTKARMEAEYRLYSTETKFHSEKLMSLTKTAYEITNETCFQLVLCQMRRLQLGQFYGLVPVIEELSKNWNDLKKKYSKILKVLEKKSDELVDIEVPLLKLKRHLNVSIAQEVKDEEAEDEFVKYPCSLDMRKLTKKHHQIRKVGTGGLKYLKDGKFQDQVDEKDKTKDGSSSSRCLRDVAHGLGGPFLNYRSWDSDKLEEKQRVFDKKLVESRFEILCGMSTPMRTLFSYSNMYGLTPDIDGKAKLFGDGNYAELADEIIKLRKTLVESDDRGKSCDGAIPTTAVIRQSLVKDPEFVAAMEKFQIAEIKVAFIDNTYVTAFDTNTVEKFEELIPKAEDDFELGIESLQKDPATGESAENARIGRYNFTGIAIEVGEIFLTPAMGPFYSPAGAGPSGVDGHGLLDGGIIVQQEREAYEKLNELLDPENNQDMFTETRRMCDLEIGNGESALQLFCFMALEKEEAHTEFTRLLTKIDTQIKLKREAAYDHRKKLLDENKHLRSGKTHPKCGKITFGQPYIKDVNSVPDELVMEHWTCPHKPLPLYKSAFDTLCLARPFLCDTMLLRQLREATTLFGKELEAIKSVGPDAEYAKALDNAIVKGYMCTKAQARNQVDLLSNQNVYQKCQSVYGHLEQWKRPFMVHAMQLLSTHEKNHSAIVAKLAELVDRALHCKQVQVKSFNILVSHAYRLVLKVSDKVNSISGANVEESNSTSDYDKALLRVYECFEDYCDDHKENAFKSAFMEPARFYHVSLTGNANDGSANNVDTHQNNWFLAVLNSTLNVHLPVFPAYWDSCNCGISDYWFGMKDSVWEEGFSQDQNFGLAWHGLSIIKDEKKSNSNFGPPQFRSKFFQPGVQDPPRGQWPKGYSVGIAKVMANDAVDSKTQESDDFTKKNMQKNLVKYLERFAHFFRRDYFVEKAFHKLNSEEKPEHAGFRKACEVLYKVYRIEQAEYFPREYFIDKELEVGELDDEFISHCFTDDWFIEFSVRNMTRFFLWLGILREKDNETDEFFKIPPRNPETKEIPINDILMGEEDDFKFQTEMPEVGEIEEIVKSVSNSRPLGISAPSAVSPVPPGLRGTSTGKSFSGDLVVHDLLDKVSRDSKASIGVLQESCQDARVAADISGATLLLPVNSSRRSLISNHTLNALSHSWLSKSEPSTAAVFLEAEGALNDLDLKVAQAFRDRDGSGLVNTLNDREGIIKSMSQEEEDERVRRQMKFTGAMPGLATPRAVTTGALPGAIPTGNSAVVPLAVNPKAPAPKVAPPKPGLPKAPALLSGGLPGKSQERFDDLNDMIKAELKKSVGGIRSVMGGKKEKHAGGKYDYQPEKTTGDSNWNVVPPLDSGAGPSSNRAGAGSSKDFRPAGGIGVGGMSGQDKMSTLLKEQAALRKQLDRMREESLKRAEGKGIDGPDTQEANLATSVSKHVLANLNTLSVASDLQKLNVDISLEAGSSSNTGNAISKTTNPILYNQIALGPTMDEAKRKEIDEFVGSFVDLLKEATSKDQHFRAACFERWQFFEMCNEMQPLVLIRAARFIIQSPKFQSILETQIAASSVDYLRDAAGIVFRLYGLWKDGDLKADANYFSRPGEDSKYKLLEQAVDAILRPLEQNTTTSWDPAFIGCLYMQVLAPWIMAARNATSTNSLRELARRTARGIIKWAQRKKDLNSARNGVKNHMYEHFVKVSHRNSSLPKDELVAERDAVWENESQDLIWQVFWKGKDPKAIVML